VAHTLLIFSARRGSDIKTLQSSKSRPEPSSSLLIIPAGVFHPPQPPFNVYPSISIVQVVDGTGQYACGSLGLGCRARESLASYELNFRYREKGDVRNELVKVRLCPDCKNLLDQARGGKGGLGAGRKERDRGKKKRRGDVRGRSESQEGRESKKERREGGRDKERAPTKEAEEGVRTQDVPQGLKGGASIRESVGAEMLAAAPSSLEVKGKASREKAMAEMDALIEDILRDGKDT